MLLSQLRPGIASLISTLIVATSLSAGTRAAWQRSKPSGADATNKQFTAKEQLDINLLVAILRQDLAAVRKAIDAGASMRAQEPPGGQRRSALSLAAYLGNEAIVRLLLEKGAPVNGYNWIHAIPLAGALDNPRFSEKPRQTDIVRLLLEHGADPNFAWGDMSSGEAVIFHKRPDILELMIKHGLKLDVPTPPSQVSLIEFVVEDSNVDMLRLMLSAGANPNALDKNGCSLLTTVTNDEIKRILVAAGGKEIVAELPPGVEQSSPTKTIDSFVSALNARDIHAMALCVLRGRPQDAASRVGWLARAMEKDAITISIAVKQVQERGDDAIAIVETDLKRDGKPLHLRVQMSEPVAMKRSGGRWRIDAYAAIPDRYERICYLNELGYDFGLLHYDFSLPNRKLSPLEVAAAVECRTLLEVLQKGVLEYAAKHGGKLTITQETLLAKAAPQFAPKVIGNCRGDNSGKISYFFNERLAGLKLSQIKDPELTILLYEGNAGKPAYRHGGRAMVAFCRNRCGLLEPMMMKGQVWGPERTSANLRARR